MLSGLLAWIAHFTAAPDLLDDDQLKPWGYTLDIILNHRWAVQTDFEGAIMSKPPLYQWLCALVAMALGEVNAASMYIPSGLAVIGCGLLVRHFAARWFGAWQGLFGGLAFVLSMLTIKHLCCARSDALFALTIAAAAFAAWHAWNQPASARSWMWFWLAAAAASMTKGPLGVVLASGGLLAAGWERRRGGLGWSLLPGALLWLAILGGWFLLAVKVGGQPVIDKMIGQELVGHAMHHEITKAGPFSKWYQPPIYFVLRYIPWCIPAIIGIVRAFLQPDADETRRRAERFLLCWFVAGLLIFCAAPHQRGDLLLPLIPAAAIFAGREVVFWMSAAPEKLRWSATAVVVTAMVSGGWWWNHIGRLSDSQVQETLAVLNLHEQFVASPQTRMSPPAFLNTTWDAQFAFGVKQPGLTLAQAVDAAKRSPGTPIVCRETDEVRAAFSGIATRVIAITTTGKSGTVFAVYVSKPSAN